MSLDSALGPAECKPESWQECWQWRAVPQGLFVQLSVGVEGLAFELQLTKEGAGVFFRRYGKTHIGEDVGGSRALVTFEHAHQARAAQQCCDRLPMAGMPGARLRVQFLGLVSWPGTNRLHRSSGSVGASLGLGACAGDFAEPSSPPTILGHALPDGSLLDPADLACSELKVGSYLSGRADVVGPMELVEPSSPPTRSGNGKGKSQSQSKCSVAASSAALELVGESEEEFLGVEAALDDDFLRDPAVLDVRCIRGVS